jgi:hypothetical protein
MAVWSKKFLPLFPIHARRVHGAHGPVSADLEKLARILVCVKKMSLNNFQKTESADGRAISRIARNCDGSQDVIALGRAGHRIASSGIIKIPQFLALKVGLYWGSAVSANLLNSERPGLENEPVGPTKNVAVLCELRPLKRGPASIGVNDHRIDGPEVTQLAHSLREIGANRRCSRPFLAGRKIVD